MKGQTTYEPIGAWEERRVDINRWNFGAICPFCNSISRIGNISARIKVRCTHPNTANNVTFEKDALCDSITPMISVKCPKCGAPMEIADANSLRPISILNELGLYVEKAHAFWYDVDRTPPCVTFLHPIPDDVWAEFMDPKNFGYVFPKDPFRTRGRFTAELDKVIDAGEPVAYILTEASKQEERTIYMDIEHYYFGSGRPNEPGSLLEVFARQCVNLPETSAISKWAKQLRAEYINLNEARKGAGFVRAATSVMRDPEVGVF